MSLFKKNKYKKREDKTNATLKIIIKNIYLRISFLIILFSKCTKKLTNKICGATWNFLMQNNTHTHVYKYILYRISLIILLHSKMQHQKMSKKNIFLLDLYMLCHHA